MSQENIYLTRGRTWSANLAVTNATSGAATDITGTSMQLTCRWTPQTNPVLFTCVNGNGITHTTAASGLFTLEISDTKTSILPNYPLTLYYELVYTDTLAKPWTILSGNILVTPAVPSNIS